MLPYHVLVCACLGERGEKLYCCSLVRRELGQSICSKDMVKQMLSEDPEEYWFHSVMACAK